VKRVDVCKRVRYLCTSQGLEGRRHWNVSPTLELRSPIDPITASNSHDDVSSGGCTNNPHSAVLQLDLETYGHTGECNVMPEQRIAAGEHEVR